MKVINSYNIFNKLDFTLCASLYTYFCKSLKFTGLVIKCSYDVQSRSNIALYNIWYLFYKCNKFYENRFNRLSLVDAQTNKLTIYFKTSDVKREKMNTEYCIVLFHSDIYISKSYISKITVKSIFYIEALKKSLITHSIFSPKRTCLFIKKKTS